MKSMDLETVEASITDLINNLPDETVNKLIYNNGFSDRSAMIRTIALEFKEVARSEDFEPLLTKGVLRTSNVAGKLPEVVIDSLVKTHLGTTNLAEKAAKEIRKQMNQPYNNTDAEHNPNYSLTEGPDRIGPYKRTHRAYDAAAMPPVSREHQLMAELESVRMGNALHAGQKYIGDQHIAALNDFMNEQKAFEPSSPFVQMFKSVGTTVGRELKSAATAEVSARINRQLIKMARQTFPQLPQGPMADTVLGFAIPTVLLLIASGMREMGDTQTMGISRQLVDGVETTAKAALGGVSRDAVRGVANAAVPMLGMVASLSSGVMQSQLEDGED